jgi:glycosyltransferase involved in cell wall biosynthesis
MGKRGDIKMREVNIIMPIHNRWEHTKQSLISLLANTDPKLCLITVVDDLSTDGTTQELDNFVKSYNRGKHIFEVYHNKTNIGPGASRNFIANAIEYRGNKRKYIYHSDSDVYFKPGWLEKLISAYEDFAPRGLRLLGAGCHPYLQNNDTWGNDDHTIGIKDAVSGYSQFMTWDTWKKYGPFDETMRNAEIKIMGSEDWAFCQKIIKDGFKVGSLQPEFVIHTGKTNTYGNLATGHEIAFPNQEGIMIK